MARYGAFLSYSRQDLAFARKLHAALEAYRIPKNAGESKATDKPDRISPLFRDQDEVSASSNLDNTLKQALADSAALIVIASVDAAESKWVNAEIEEFIRLGRGSKIFVAVPPYVSAERSFRLNSIFPPALAKLGEPLAADFRKSNDGWTLGKLKLVAGVAGIELVRLRDRDAARRLRNGIAATVAAIAIVGVLGATAFSALQAQQRAKQEMLARAVENIRTSLVSDQPGNALAYVDNVDRDDVTPEVAAALDRVSLFWSEHVVSPRDVIAAMPQGARVQIGNALYYRTGNGIVPMPAAGNGSIYQSRDGSLIIFDDSGAVTRLNPSTGEMTTLDEHTPASENVYELPSGALLATATAGGGGGMGGEYPVGTVIYPGGDNAGVLQAMVFTDFYANEDCTKLFYADGPKGYGQPTSGGPSATYVQTLYSGRDNPQEFTAVSDVPLTLNVVTLTGSGDWHEAEVDRPGGDTFDNFASDWLQTKGQLVDQACAPYALHGGSIGRGDVRAVTIPAFSADTLIRADRLSPASIWTSTHWVDARLLTDETFDLDVTATPDIYGQDDSGGRFAVFQKYYQGANTDHMVTLFCSQASGGQARCTSTNSVSDNGRLTLLPHANLVAMGGEFGFYDLSTLTNLPWAGGGEDQAVGESPDGATIMAITKEGDIHVYSYVRGSAPQAIRTISNSNFANAKGISPIDATDALVATTDGALMRVNTFTGETKWTLRDRALEGAVQGSVNYVGDKLVLAASNNRQIAAAATSTGVRLYDVTLGVPLTPFYTFAASNVRGAMSAMRLVVGDDGSLWIGNASVALAHRAPSPRQNGGGDSACLYGARVIDGRATAVDIIGDANMRQTCGLNSLSN